MIALAFLTLLATVTPNPIRIAPGGTVSVEVDFGPGGFVHGAGFGAEDRTVADVWGWLAPNVSTGTITVRGVREGRTRLIVEYIAGMGVWRHPVADILVEEPCDPPTVTLNLQHVRIAEGSALTLAAMTTGSEPVHVEWYEGTRFRGRGTPLTLRSLPAGTVRLNARVTNRCGAAVSAEAVVEVVPPRRRAVRK